MRGRERRTGDSRRFAEEEKEEKKEMESAKGIGSGRERRREG